MRAAIVRVSPSELGAPGWQQRLDDALDERAAAVVVVAGPAEAWSRIEPNLVRSIPAVTLAVVCDSGAEPPPAAAACDLCATNLKPESQLNAWIDSVADHVGRSPLAVTALARTLRLTERLPVDEGLVVESLTYSVLQAGPEHQRWLAQRNLRKWNETL